MFRRDDDRPHGTQVARRGGPRGRACRHPRGDHRRGVIGGVKAERERGGTRLARVARRALLERVGSSIAARRADRCGIGWEAEGPYFMRRVARSAWRPSIVPKSRRPSFSSTPMTRAPSIGVRFRIGERYGYADTSTPRARGLNAGRTIKRSVMRNAGTLTVAPRSSF